MTAVAVLGTGIMGSGMARSLARRGHDVRVWNRTAAKAGKLGMQDSITVSLTPAGAVCGAEVVITMLTDGPAVLEAMHAAEEGLRAGQVWLQSSTVGVAAFPDLVGFAARFGLDMVDAPVMGTRPGAESGQLLVFAAGSASARDRAADVLAAIAARTVWLADDPAGAAATRLKIVLNSWVLTLATGTAEAIALAEGLGLERTTFAAAIAGGPLDSPYLQAKAAAIAEGRFSPDFGLATAAKDARLILGDAADAGIRLDLIAAAADRFRRAIDQGHADSDLSATYHASFLQNGDRA